MHGCKLVGRLAGRSAWRIGTLIVLAKYLVSSLRSSVVRPTMCKKKHSHGEMGVKGFGRKAKSFIAVTITIENNRLSFGGTQ